MIKMCSLNLLLYIFSIIFLFIVFFNLYFKRDPKRNIVLNEKYILSPADGKVIDIIRNDECYIIKIFMNIFDVHIQRSPVSGVIEDIEYKKGKFVPADREQASEKNEQNIITINSKYGIFKVKQIAGVLARRIKCWLEKNKQITQGEKIGMILLGSQVDLYIYNKKIDLKINKFDKVKSGITVIAEI